jgi:hypothetical protein
MGSHCVAQTGLEFLGSSWDRRSVPPCKLFLMMQGMEPRASRMLGNAAALSCTPAPPTFWYITERTYGNSVTL